MNVTVVGLGKLGAVLAAVLADAGNRVYGVDTNTSSVDAINAGLAPVDETGLQDLFDGIEPGLLTATTNYAEAVPNSDMSMIVVPTPSGPDDKFINDYVAQAIEEVGRNVDDWHTVVICSTIMPGSSDKFLIPILENASDRKVGHTIGYCYNPEFIALGSVIHDMQNPDLVLIGSQDDHSTADLVELTESYTFGAPVFAVLRYAEAELAKISVNSYVTMKISYANTVAEIAERIDGVSAHNVLKAVGGDSRIGNKYLNPGASFGGPCFPRDNKAFASLAHDLNVDPSLAIATDDVNRRLYSRISFLLRDFHRVAVLGLSYKPETAVTEEAMGLMVARSLAGAECQVKVHDPQATPVLPPGVEQCKTVEDTIKNVDVVLVATPWEEYRNVDFGTRKVIDMWDCTQPVGNRRVVGQHCWWWTP